MPFHHNSIPVLMAAVTIAINGEAYCQLRGHVYESKNKNGEVDAIVFDGYAEWLAKQHDPKSHFHELPHLRRLTLAKHDVSGAEMAYIVGLKNVKWLDVGCASTGFADEDVNITGESLALVGGMSWLEELEVSTSGLSDKDWAFLPKLKSLKLLRIGKSLAVTDSVLGYIAEVKSLERLDVRGDNSFTDDAFGRLSGLRKLKALSISSPRLTDDGLKSLANLKDLEELQLDGGLTAKSIQHMRSLHNLRQLSLGIKSVPMTAMETIATFQQLERLNLYKAKIGDEELAVLRDHPSLRRLYLDSAEVTDRSFPVLRSLKKLEYVSLRSNETSRQIEDTVNKQIPLNVLRDKSK